MPPVQAISVDKNRLTVRDARAVSTFDATQIPANKTLVADLEDYLNTVYLPSVVPTTAITLGTQPAYQLVAHVYSVSPLVVTAWCANAEEPPPPADWWKEGAL